MLSDTLVDSPQFTVRVRDRGQMTIPSKLRESLSIDKGDMLTLVQMGKGFYLASRPLRTYKLSDKIADMMEEEGVTLTDLLEDLPKIREEIYQEQYGQETS
ncbi:MAG: hypothetical protein MAG431_00844 [Chloroflexi bacterium]|nr:hypothetical protein [Chloroflexota bacterium]